MLGKVKKHIIPNSGFHDDEYLGQNQVKNQHPQHIQ